MTMGWGMLVRGANQAAERMANPRPSVEGPDPFRAVRDSIEQMLNDLLFELKQVTFPPKNPSGPDSIALSKSVAAVNASKLCSGSIAARIGALSIHTDAFTPSQARVHGWLINRRRFRAL